MDSVDFNCVYLSHSTNKRLYEPSIERLKEIYSENHDAVSSLEVLKSVLKETESRYPSFLFDLTKEIMLASGLKIDLQESYLRMKLSDEDHEYHKIHIPQFRSLVKGVNALETILSRIPDDIGLRKPFLATIKEIAASIKYLLDTITSLIPMLPLKSQPVIEKRKREFVHYSKRFSNALKDYFKEQNPTQVFLAANLLNFYTTNLIRALLEKVPRHSIN